MEGRIVEGVEEDRRVVVVDVEEEGCKVVNQSEVGEGPLQRNIVGS